LTLAGETVSYLQQMSAQTQVLPYDAILLVSFGGPEGIDDVMPFLENVLRGRNVPRERMLEVAKHYELFGGVSPINEQNRQLIAALEQELNANGPKLPIYFGNRNWHPLLADTLRKMRDDGIRSALAFVTSAYSSYPGCRQYLENIAAAREEVGPDAPRVDKIRAFYNHPEFIRANVAQIETVLANVPKEQRPLVHLVFTAHSIPQSMAQNCDYVEQLKETSMLIAASLGIDNWQLNFQSRTGSPEQPWLGPDICDYLQELKSEGVNDVVVAPIGFVSDHMEIIYDLDMEARELCEHIGLKMWRAATAGTHPAFIKMIRELILERIDQTREPKVFGVRPPAPPRCEAGCCLPGHYPLR
jgi:ferrochelatase